MQRGKRWVQRVAMGSGAMLLACVAHADDAPNALSEAHDKLLAEKGLQFSFDLVAAPEPPPSGDGWKWLGDFINFIAPALEWVFWGAVIVLLLGLAFVLIRETVRSRRFAGEGAGDAGATVDIRPTESQARALLEEADALAANGRFADAVRVILHTSIDDIDRKLPNTIRRNLTSREIARLGSLPTTARSAFASIAQIVERAWFAGRLVDASDYDVCRSTYRSFAELREIAR